MCTIMRLLRMSQSIHLAVVETNNLPKKIFISTLSPRVSSINMADTAVAKKLQPSRKGKKAWRKNIDMEPVEEGLESNREEERVR